MKILIACEESQRVCGEMRNLRHEAYSCDILPAGGGHPEWHIQSDCLPLINGDCTFSTMDGEEHTIDGPWDLLIAHPPCTYLCVSGNRWFNVEKYGEKAIQRQECRRHGIAFFMQFVDSNCPRVAIENPIGVMSTLYRKPDQIIQPWEFGHGEIKATCLWLKNLPLLKPTKIVDGREARVWRMPPSKDRAKERSKTYPGIAKAMAEQWAGPTTSKE